MRNWQPKDITWTNLSPTPQHSHKMNSVMRAYCVSKMCNVLHAKDIAQRLKVLFVTVLPTKTLHLFAVARCDLLQCASGPYRHQHSAQRRLHAQTNQVLSVHVARCGMTQSKSHSIKILKMQEVGSATVVYCALVPDLGDFGNGQYFNLVRSAEDWAQNKPNSVSRRQSYVSINTRRQCAGVARVVRRDAV